MPTYAFSYLTISGPYRFFGQIILLLLGSPRTSKRCIRGLLVYSPHSYSVNQHPSAGERHASFIRLIIVCRWVARSSHRSDCRQAAPFRIDG